MFCGILTTILNAIVVMECIGAEGNVDESLAVLAEVETLKAKKKEAEVKTCLVTSQNEELFCIHYNHSYVNGDRVKVATKIDMIRIWPCKISLFSIML